MDKSNYLGCFLTAISVIFVVITVVVFIGARIYFAKPLAQVGGYLQETNIAYGNGNRRLAAYHEFEDTYQRIKAQIHSIQQLSVPNDLSTIAEIKIVNTWIADYNARSREYDQAEFKARHLPHSLSYFSWTWKE
jgi:hypothetical protein